MLCVTVDFSPVHMPCTLLLVMLSEQNDNLSKMYTATMKYQGSKYYQRSIPRYMVIDFAIKITDIGDIPNYLITSSSNITLDVANITKTKMNRIGKSNVIRQ